MPTSESAVDDDGDSPNTAEAERRRAAAEAKAAKAEAKAAKAAAKAEAQLAEAERRRVSEKAEAGRRLLGLSGSRSCRSQRMLTGALAAFDERIKSSEAREFEL